MILVQALEMANWDWIDKNLNKSHLESLKDQTKRGTDDTRVECTIDSPE